MVILFFFFNDTATTEIYTLSLHDALPICLSGLGVNVASELGATPDVELIAWLKRSEEHTSELQSQSNLVCRLLLEKKKTNIDSDQSCHLSMLARSTPCLYCSIKHICSSVN